MKNFVLTFASLLIVSLLLVVASDCRYVSSSSASSSSGKQIVVFGNINLDFVSYVDRFPLPGEGVRANDFKMYFGGKGASVAAQAAKLGSRVKLVAVVGDDAFGVEGIKVLRDSGVNTDFVFTSETGAPTATTTININAEGENAIIGNPGANSELSARHARVVEKEVARSAIVIGQSSKSSDDQSGTVELFQIARDHGVTTFLNAGRPNLDARILPLTDIITVNENEAGFVTGRQDLHSLNDFDEAARSMLQMGPRVVIITLGSRGALVAYKSTDENNDEKINVEYIKAAKVKAVYTVGAGDSFCGSFAHFFAENPSADIVEMVRKASKIATISVQRQGSIISYPTREELVKMGVL